MTTLRDDCVALFPGQGSISAGAGKPWRDSRHWSLVGEISDEEPSSATIADVFDLADGIANMATTLKRNGIARPRSSAMEAD